jgi:PAS domain S-box-containing protein
MTTIAPPVVTQVWRVVVVDDSPDDRAEVRRLLLNGSERQYRFVEAENGAGGVRAILDAAGEPPDCVVLDYYLPDMDAVEVLAALAGPAGLTVCPVVVLTGNVGYEQTHAVLRAGAQDYLGKGWMSPESLTRAVENAAERWALSRDLQAREVELARLAAIVTCCDDAIVGKDLDGRITSWNRGAENLFGYLAAEVIGRPITLLIPDGYIQEEREFLDRVRCGETVHFETVRRRKGAGTGNAEVELATKRFVRVNRKFCAMVGYSADELLAGMTFLDVTHPHDRDSDTADITLHIQEQNGAFEIEKRYIRKDGGVVWVHLTTSFIRDAQGSPTRMLGSVTDITDRKRAEEQLRRNHDAFAQLIQNNPFGVYVVDADFRMRLASVGTTKVFSAVHPLLGRDFAEVIRVIWPEPFASEVIQRFRHTLATGEPYSALSTGERRADIGEQESYDWRIERVALPEGRFGVVCYFYDLSERNRWETALLVKEQELRSLTDNTPDILTRFDNDLRHVFANAAVEKATGRTRAEFTGKTNRDLGMPEDLCNLWDAATRDVFETGDHKSLEFAYDTPHGLRYYAARFVPEIGTDGTVEFVIAVAHDVTDRKLSEEAVRASEGRLRLALAAGRAGAWAWEIKTGAITWSPENYALYGLDEADGPPAYADWEARLHPDDRGRAEAAVRDTLQGRTPEFRSEFRVKHPTDGTRWLLGLGRVEFAPDGTAVRMIGINLDITDRKRFEQTLADQDRRKDEFLATLAHELRNPLAPLRNGLSILRMGSLSDQTAELVGMMDRQLGHLVNLVDDLLDVSRVRSGKISLRTERLTIRELVEAAVEACRPTIDDQGHALAVDLPADGLVIIGDKTRLVQVFANLLTNAAKYSEPGGRIRVSATQDAGKAVIAVSDTGMGIAPDLIATLWDMFTQVRDTLDKSQGGLGIGLSLVKKLVEMHGGTATAASDGVGRGSTFTICLPLATTASGRTATTLPGANLTVSSRPAAWRVLVVDDNLDAAKSLAMLLQISGHETTIAHSGLSALDTARAFSPDLVMLDIGLPGGMDGYEVARRLRAEPQMAETVLVALTGWGSEEDKQKSKDAGFDFHLTKPIEADAVEAVLARFLSSPKGENAVPPKTRALFGSSG